MLTPAEIIIRKNLVTHPDLTSDDWASISTGIKDRAFFSSRVESVRFLDVCRTRIAELLDGARNQDGAITSRAQVVSDIMRAARESGIATGTGTLTDPGSASRAGVIVDTNAGMAAGYTAALQSNTFGARLAFPAQELIRIEERRVPRNWSARWTAAGGHLYQGRMIALKEDPVWTKISRFGTPYPPFDFNSGMGVEDVSYEEAVELGVIKEDYQPPEKSPMKAFNEKLEADCEFKSDYNWTLLKTIFGDQIRQDGDKIVWRQDAIKDAFLSRKPFSMKLGEATPDLIGKIPDSDIALHTATQQLIIDGSWLDNRRQDDSDHRTHFYPLESDDRNIPLQLSDLELLPDIWRHPDKVEKVSKTRLMLSMRATDGGMYRVVIETENTDARLVTFYKNKMKPNLQN